MFLGKLHSKTEREFALRDMPGNPDTDATIKIRLLSPGERREVAEAAMNVVWHPDENDTMTPEIKNNQRGGVEKLFFKSVIGWTGIYEDADGKKPLAFGTAGKRILLDLLPELADFVGACHAKMVKAAEEAREPEQKNS